MAQPNLTTGYHCLGITNADPWSSNIPTGLQNYPGQPSQAGNALDAMVDDNGNPLSIEEVERFIDENPDAFQVDYNAMAAKYGHAAGYVMLGNDTKDLDASGTIGSNQNTFSGDFEEALNAKTPNYLGFDGNTPDYAALSSSTSAPSSTMQPQVGFQPYGAQSQFSNGAVQPYTPFNPHMVKTPYVPKTPHIVDDDGYLGTTFNNNLSGSIPGSANVMAQSDQTDLSVQSSIENTDYPVDSGPGMHSPIIGPKPRATAAKKAQTTKKTPVKKTPAKKAAATRAKGKGKAVGSPVTTSVAENEDDDADVELAEEDDEEEVIEVAPKATAKGRGRKKAAPKTQTAATKKRGSGAKKTTKATTTKASTRVSARIRAPAKNGITACKPIPHSLEDCDDADKALIQMRDAGRPWPEIKAAYEALSGSTHGNSTLPNRYARLKTALISFRDEDNVLLFEAKKDIEAEFEARKWDLIAAEVSKKGGLDYEAGVCQRQFKKLMTKEGFDVARGEQRGDADFADGDEGGASVYDGAVQDTTPGPVIEWDGYVDEQQQDDMDIDAEGEEEY